MIRITPTLKTIISRNKNIHRQFSTKQSALAGDSGPVATHVNHKISTFLAIAAPAVLFSPDSWTDGFIDKAFGAILTLNIGVHSWVGMNYVITDYVPKLSKSLVGPARVVSAGMSGLTVLGLSYVVVASPGGIKGLAKGLWTPKKKDD